MLVEPPVKITSASEPFVTTPLSLSAFEVIEALLDTSAIKSFVFCKYALFITLPCVIPLDALFVYVTPVPPFSSSVPLPLIAPRLPPLALPLPIAIFPSFAIVPLFVNVSVILTGLLNVALFVNVFPLDTAIVFCVIAALFAVSPLIVKLPVPSIVFALLPPV